MKNLSISAEIEIKNTILEKLSNMDDINRINLLISLRSFVINEIEVYNNESARLKITQGQ